MSSFDLFFVILSHCLAAFWLSERNGCYCISDKENILLVDIVDWKKYTIWARGYKVILPWWRWWIIKYVFFYVPVLYEITAFIMESWIIQASISKVNIYAVLTTCTLSLQSWLEVFLIKVGIFEGNIVREYPLLFHRHSWSPENESYWPSPDFSSEVDILGF